MKVFRKHITAMGIYFLIALFTYAALTKLMEGDRFYLNLLNSPILSIGKSWTFLVSWFIPLVELLIVLFLIYPKTKLAGLYMSSVLLSIYFIYILGLLFMASYQPCSCGGIAKFLSWEQQLWFTLGCLGIACMTLYLKSPLTALRVTDG